MSHPSNVTCNFFRRNNKDAEPISWKIAKAMSLAYARIDIVPREIAQRSVSSLGFHVLFLLDFTDAHFVRAI